MRVVIEVFLQNLYDNACGGGGLLKFFEMLTMVKALLCDEDQGRESRLFFANGFPWAPAPTTAPTPAPIKVLSPVPTPVVTSATSTISTLAPTPYPAPPHAQTPAPTESSTPTPTLAAPDPATTTTSAQASKSCNCGIPLINRNRIVGGRPANKVLTGSSV